MYYYNIPSAGPMTKQEAYREAVYRFGVNRKTARQEFDGITYQGPHGATEYVKWSDLPAATRA